MLNLLFFLISRLNNVCSPLVVNLQINLPIGIKESNLKVPSSVTIVKIELKSLEFFFTLTEDYISKLLKRDCMRNLNSPLMQRWKFLIHNGTLGTFILEIMGKILSFYQVEKCSILIIPLIFLAIEVRKSLETTVENNQFKRL